MSLTVDDLAGFVRTLWQNAAASDRLPVNLASVRSLSLLGITDDAARLHGLISDHDPAACPICAPDVQIATSGDADAASAAIIAGNLATGGVTREQISTTFRRLLAEAQAAIPFFETYALDPSMTSPQWTAFQALDQTTKDRLLYDAVRSLAALMRYLTGNLPTA